MLGEFSAEIYKTVLSGNFCLILTPMAFARWVLPKPTPPNINNGLNEVPPGRFDTLHNLQIWPTDLNHLQKIIEIVIWDSIENQFLNF